MIGLVNQNSLESEFNSLIASESVSWMNDLRSKAYSHWTKLKLPNQSHESFRKISLSGFFPESFFQKEDKQVISTRILQNQSGIKWKQLEDLDSVETEFVKSNLERLISSYSQEYFPMLSIAFHNSFSYIDIPDNFTSDELVKLEISFREYTKLVIPLVFLRVGKFSKVHILEKITAPHSDEDHLFLGFNFIQEEEGASSDLSLIEEFTDSTYHFRTIHQELQKDTNSKFGYFNLGGFKGKTFINTHLKGTGSSLYSFGVGSSKNREKQDIEYSIFHEGNQTQSQLEFRAVLKDKSHHVFTGNLKIPKSVKNASASQVNNNLLIHKTARAESMPKLDVLALDVQCSHGATVGEVTEDELFYLKSRGLPEPVARQLIIEGFITELVDKTHEAVSQELRSRILQRLGGANV